MLFWYSIRRLIEYNKANTSRLHAELKLQDEIKNRQKVEVIGQITAGIAHDFNNLLAIVTGNAELLAEQLEKNNANILAIIDASNRGADLTHHLLSFSRQQQLQSKPIDPHKFFPDLKVKFLSTLERQQNLILKIDVDAWTLLADARQLEIAILNLLKNGAKAMPDDGTIRIYCGNHQQYDPTENERPSKSLHDYIIISVTDNGHGMAEETSLRAFEPFFTTNEVGQGLGLSMVFGFAQQSKGFVTITSAPEKGTTVSLFLPRAVTNSFSPEGAPVNPQLP